MEGGAERPGPDRDELLDNTPEAVAMRKARAARAASAATPGTGPGPRPLRRRLVLGAVLGGVAAARVLSMLAARRGRP